MQKLKYSAIHLPVFPLLWLGLLIDSPSMALIIPDNQWLTNVLVILAYLWIYAHVSRVVKKLMLYGLIVATGGEVLFSLILGMYTYRLDNVPVYVPFGHAVIYAAIYYLSKEPLIQAHQHRIYSVLQIFIFIYGLLWLYFAQDVFGFACSLITLWLLHRRPSARPFFSMMFVMVIYLELLGTHYQCWQWPDIWFGALTWVPSANPPSGIGMFYFAFDLGCLWFYKQHYPVRWRRFRNVRRLRKASLQAQSA